MTSAKHWYDQGVQHYQAGQDQDALQCFEQAIKLDPNDAYAWNRKGHALSNLNRYAEALEAYEQAIKLNPRYVYAWNGKGNALSDLKHHSEALEAFEKAINLDPNNANAWNGKGGVFWNLIRYVEALEAFEKAISLDANNTYPWYGKGIILWDLERYSEALEAFEKAISLDSNDAFAWYAKGEQLWSLGRYSEALETFEQAIHHARSFACPWHGKAKVFLLLKRYPEALEASIQSVFLNSNDANAWYEKGAVLHRLERYSEALKAYEKSISLDSNDAFAWHQKGNALEDLKRYSEALEAHTQAIFLAPLEPIIWNEFIQLIKEVDAPIHLPKHPELEETLLYLVAYLHYGTLPQASLEAWMKKTILQEEWHLLQIQLLLLVAQEFPKDFPKTVLLRFFKQFSLRNLQLLCSRLSLSLFSLCQLHLPDQSALIFLLRLYENIPASHLQRSHFLMFNLFYEEEDLSQCMQLLHPMDQYDYKCYRASLKEEQTSWWELLISEGELQELTFSPSIRGRVIEKARQYLLQQINDPETEDPFDPPGLLVGTIIDNIENIPANWIEPLSLLWVQLTVEAILVEYAGKTNREKLIERLIEEQGHWRQDYRNMQEAWQETKEPLSLHFDRDPGFWKWCQAIESQYPVLISGSAEELLSFLEPRLYPDPNEKEIWQVPLLI